MTLRSVLDAAKPRPAGMRRRFSFRTALAGVVLLVACGHADRLVQIRVSELAQPAPDSEETLERDAVVVRKRLSEVAELLGFEERPPGGAPTIVRFSQPGAQAPVEMTARSDSGAILVEVAQRAPKDSIATVFEKARLLVQERLEQDFGERVTEAAGGKEFWSWIRSEDQRTK